MARKTVRSTEPTPELDFAPLAEPQAIPFVAGEVPPEAPPAAVAAPPPPIAAAPPPTPPAPGVWPPPRDVWFVELPIPSFNRSLPVGRASPAAMFGIFDPASHVSDSEWRVGRMAKWFRGQQNAPWQWIDGELKRVGNFQIRHRRMDTTTRECAAARLDWAKSVRDFEVELEQRIRIYLGGTPKEQENAATLSVMQMNGGAVPLSSPRAHQGPPPFCVASFIGKAAARGLIVEMDKASGRPVYRGPAALISASDYQEIDRYWPEIAGYFLVRAELAKAAAERAAKAG